MAADLGFSRQITLRVRSVVYRFNECQISTVRMAELKRSVWGQGADKGSKLVQGRVHGKTLTVFQAFLTISLPCVPYSA